MKTKKLVLIIFLIAFIGIGLFIVKGPILNHFEYTRLKTEYEKIRYKSFEEMSESEWILQNKYLAIEAKRKNLPVDTIPWLSAYMQNALNKYQNDAACQHQELVNQFHSMMKFNRPYEKYDPNKILIQQDGDCALRISVTTTDQEFGFKTHWVFQVTLDQPTNRYRLYTISKNFIG